MAHSASATQSAWKAESGALYSRLKWLSARRETFNTVVLFSFLFSFAFVFVSTLAAHATGACLGGALVQRAKERLQRLAPGELEPLGLATLDGERRLKLHHVLEICVAPEALQQRVRWHLCGVIMCV